MCTRHRHGDALASPLPDKFVHHWLPGGYGPFESDSKDLLAYLSRLEEQQRVVIELMAAARANPGPGPAQNPGAPRRSGSVAGSVAVFSPGVSASVAGRRRSSAGAQRLPPLGPRPAVAGMPARALAPAPMAAHERVAQELGMPPPQAPPPALRPRYFGTATSVAGVIHIAPLSFCLHSPCSV